MGPCALFRYENFSAGARGGRSAPSVNSGPPHISETTRARKSKLYTHLDRAKYSFQVWKFFRYSTPTRNFSTIFQLTDLFQSFVFYCFFILSIFLLFRVLCCEQCRRRCRQNSTHHTHVTDTKHIKAIPAKWFADKKTKKYIPLRQ